ncbi:hypothetical protein RI103_08895 [Paraburkholderia sp. FT54]|nr:hypothetical protein [Paraburkholderia sp. FT54]WNC91444.1 hypothetical protein RI103_08895 [Paraburkholderia sp. FT54]
MTEQDWVMAGVYLVGLVSIALLMSALAARATRERQAARVSSRVRD